MSSNMDQVSHYRKRKREPSCEPARHPPTRDRRASRAGQTVDVKATGRRYRPSPTALKGIRKYQRTQTVLVPLPPFIELVREIALAMVPDGTMLWCDSALLCLKDATEDYLVHMFEQGHQGMLHAKRKTLMVKDIQLARRVSGLL